MFSNDGELGTIDVQVKMFTRKQNCKSFTFGLGVTLFHWAKQRDFPGIGWHQQWWRSCEDRNMTEWYHW